MQRSSERAIVACRAVASLGAVWSVCAPDMGLASVLDRFRQIEPVALVAVPSSHYNGKPIDKGAVLAEMVAALPSVKTLILMPGESSHPLPQGVTVAQDRQSNRLNSSH